METSSSLTPGFASTKSMIDLSMSLTRDRHCEPSDELIRESPTPEMSVTSPPAMPSKRCSAAWLPSHSWAICWALSRLSPLRRSSVIFALSAASRAFCCALSESEVRPSRGTGSGCAPSPPPSCSAACSSARCTDGCTPQSRDSDSG